MDYGLCYLGYPSVLEGYSDASWITVVEDHSSTTGCSYLGEVLSIGLPRSRSVLQAQQWNRSLLR